MNHQQLAEKLIRIKLLVDECLRELAVSQRHHRTHAMPPPKSLSVTAEVDFSLPVRPFVKKYSVGLSGPKKFTLLLARLADGKLNSEVALADLEKAWSGMTALMGMSFNRNFTQVAKDNDWVETKKKGIYTLRPSWKKAIGHA